MANYLITIGIDHYQSDVFRDFIHGNCRLDCDRFADTLVNKFEGFIPYAALRDETATLQGIKDTLQGFLDTDLNTPANNLVLYFSGHGHILNLSYGIQSGCWIPHGCKQGAENEVFAYDTLTYYLKRLNTRHKLLISDSCNSGAIFDEFRPENPGEAVLVDGDELSFWAIVSSRSNEKSKAGRKGENSLFTKQLLAILTDHEKDRLHVTYLWEELDKRFAKEQSQKPMIGRLKFGAAPNSGMFSLFPKGEVVDFGARKGILTRSLFLLNYSAQKAKFATYKEECRKQVTIFSDKPDAGLLLLANKATKSAYFPKTFKNKFTFSDQGISDYGDKIVLMLFNKALDTNLSSEAALISKILNLLQNQSLVFEFRFYNNPGTPPQLRPKDKVRTLNQIIAFIASINNEQTASYHQIFLFVVDQENVNYHKLYEGANILGLKTVYMPAVENLELEALNQWYYDMRENQGEAKFNDFDEIFDSVLGTRLAEIHAITNGAPGATIRKICDATSCSEILQGLFN